MDQSINLTESVNYYSELIYKEIEKNMWTLEDLKQTFLTKCPVDKFLLSLKTLEVSGKIEKRYLMGREFYTIALKNKYF